jgi:hypothetical protein
MSERLLHLDGQPLPPIEPGEVLRRTPNFWVVTDYKPGLEGQRGGERFYIEPSSRAGEDMLESAAVAHNIYNFDLRSREYRRGVYVSPSLRADYIPGNIPVLLQGEVKIPEPGKDTIPSPDRMEACIARDRFGDYTFADDLPRDFGVPNPHVRQLRVLQATHSDETPEEVVHSSDNNRWYKVRTGWWITMLDTIQNALARSEIADAALLEAIEPFMAKYSDREFLRAEHLTTAEDIAAANALIDRIWEAHGV